MTEPAVSPFVLAIAYWLHMLSTVVWIGSLAAVSLIVLPAARRSLDQVAFGALLTRLSASLQRIGWFSLAVLIVTGLFQMSASPFYKGFLAIANPWAIAILAKHLVVGLMILTGAYTTWGLLPALQRATLLRASGRAAAGRMVSEEQFAALQRREIWLLRANLGISIIVLLLTALARTAR